MSNQLQSPRGTRDIFGQEMTNFNRVVDKAKQQAKLYGFEEIATPIFEFTEVFKRPLGDTSDIVTKEMYTFEDKGGESITLRPELTASVIRAIITNNLAQTLPIKYYYYGPMFRYERPQKGRYRQFHQFGAELLGADSPTADIEVIAIAYDFLKSLNVHEKVTLEVNTLGDLESRQNYRDALIAYFTKYESSLSDDSKNRLHKNPLRILDSKDEGDRKIIADAPKFSSFLNTTSKEFFDAVINGLETLNIPFMINERMVRGLDYYTHTAFEFTTQLLGSQGTVLAGGRYDGLMKQMGGPDIAGVGWGSGIERLSMLLSETTETSNYVVIVPMSEVAEKLALSLSQTLRQNNIAVNQSYSGNMKKRMQYANRIGAKFAIIIGEDEIATGRFAVKNLISGEQANIDAGQLVTHLKSQI